MSKVTRTNLRAYTIVQVESFDGSTTFELRQGTDTLKVYPAEALQHAIDALQRIEEFQGLTKEAELYKLEPGAVATKTESDES